MRTRPAPSRSTATPSLQRAACWGLALAFAATAWLGCESKPAKPAAEAPAKATSATPAPAKPAPTTPPAPAKPAIPEATARGNDKRPMVQVPAGPFIRGSKPGEGLAEESPQKTLTLKAFWIDQKEVTVQDYMACLKAGGCKASNHRASKKPKAGKKKSRPPSCNADIAGRETHPMNCVTWAGAKAYCAWAGKRLPTEAEWEKAARGGDGRKFPWGATAADCTRACMVKGASYGCGQRTTCPAGSKPLGASPYGALDMSGNVAEWVTDTYARDAYGKLPDADPVYSAKGKDRPIRGGAYGSDVEGVRAAQRAGFPADSKISFAGFRCAMDP